MLTLQKQLSKSYQPPNITFLPHASQSSVCRQPGKLHAYSWLTFQDSLTVSFKCHGTLKPCIYEFLLLREWCSLFRIMFYHNVLLLSSCYASSNTYTRRESALAFPPPAFSRSCMLLTIYFFSSSLFVGLRGFFFCKLHRITGAEKNLQPFLRCCLRLASLPRGVAGWDTGSCPQPAPRRGVGSLAAVQAGTPLSSNFPCRNSARCRQPDKAALTLIEIFSRVMLEHQSNQQRSGRI